MLKGIAVASLTMLFSSFGSMVFAQNHSHSVFSQNVPLNKPLKIEPVGQPAPTGQPASPNSLIKSRPGQGLMMPTTPKPASTVTRPYPPGTPCGKTFINGQEVFVSPQTVPGSYCDRDGTLQYR